jgi:hypothetical protein
MVNLGTTLALPSFAVQEEWTAARNQYTGMTNAGKDLFGQDIWNKIDVWYDQDTPEKKNAYISRNPEVQQALDWKAGYIANNRLLAAYYDGIGNIENYYKGIMRKDITNKLGEDIWSIMQDYNYMNTWGDANQAKNFKRQHPEIQKYYDLSDKWYATIDRKVADYSKNVPKGQGPILQQLSGELSIGQQDITKALNTPQLSWEDVASQMPQDLLEAVAGYYSGGEFTYAQETRLDRIAKQFGIDRYQLIQLAGR